MRKCEKCGREAFTERGKGTGCHRKARVIAGSDPTVIADRECAAHAEIATLRARVEALTKALADLIKHAEKAAAYVETAAHIIADGPDGDEDDTADALETASECTDAAARAARALTATAPTACEVKP